MDVFKVRQIQGRMLRENFSFCLLAEIVWRRENVLASRRTKRANMNANIQHEKHLNCIFFLQVIMVEWSHILMKNDTKARRIFFRFSGTNGGNVISSGSKTFFALAEYMHWANQEENILFFSFSFFLIKHSVLLSLSFLLMCDRCFFLRKCIRAPRAQFKVRSHMI